MSQEAKPGQMIPIAISDFLTGANTVVDLYIKLADDKYILIVKKGNKTEREQLMNYKNKRLDYLYVHKSDFAKMSMQNIAIAGVLISSDKLDPKRKGQIFKAATTLAFKQVDMLGMTTDLVEQAKHISEATLNFCEAHKDLSGLLANMNEASDELVAHSIAVSTLSVMLGQQMGITQRVTLEKLALGGLLHDIGKKNLPPEILKKPLVSMTPEENQVYETHAYKGMQLLSAVGNVPDDIVSIVYEHHENSLGQGYPRRIRDVVIHPLAKIVALADEFVYLTVKSLNCPQPRNPREALVYIEHTMGQPFNRDAFKALNALVEKNNTQKAS